MKEVEILNLRNRKSFDEGRRRKFVTVKNKKKVSASLRRDLYRNYGFKLVDN
jgi:hypothetical protein